MQGGRRQSAIATAAVIGAGDFIGSAIAKTSRDAGSTKSAKATGFLDR